MEANEILEGNKIIAEFMGVIYHPPTRTEDYYYMGGYKEWEYPDGTFYQTDDLEYHTSWDWLMPVVEKIENMGYMTIIGANAAFGGHYMNIMTGIKMPNDTFKNPTKFMGAEDTKLATIYSAVIQFINWYNTNK